MTTPTQVTGTWKELFPPKTSNWTAEDMPELTGRVYIVTGGNSGIGKETVKALLKKGGKVYMASRNETLAREAIEDLERETGRTAIFLKLDLADLASVKQAAEEFMAMESQLNTLFNNAAIAWSPIDELTAQDYDLQFGTNVLGHFYFTKLLLPVLFQTYDANPSDKPRVVTNSGTIHKTFPKIDYETLRDSKKRRKLTPNQIYSQSKFGNVLLANELARRYGDKIVATSLHPGVYFGRLQRYVGLKEWGIVRWGWDLFFLPHSMSAYTQLFAGTAPEAANMNGKYLVPWATEGRMHKEATKQEISEKLWDWMEEQVAKM
ncbi:NAD(P)-binding protein [Exidia glandulosa HHB12029]|uniref:NAD(P)-binding protein n=1 Tax=Exidia glandulosa HHB12029 TaxID=1314781 RepID=A0A166AB54_EXIGL|nr:NAD(P)-binding protein [Exidia glandulosa HHB12029]